MKHLIFTAVITSSLLLTSCGGRTSSNATKSENKDTTLNAAVYKELAEAEGAQVLPICARMEQEIAELEDRIQKIGSVHSVKQIAEEEKEFPVECQFCDTTYEFTPEQVAELIENI